MRNQHKEQSSIYKKNRLDTTPYPSGHRPQRPCAQKRTRAKQDRAHANAPGQNRTRSVGGATTHGWRTRQVSERVQTQMRSGAGGCTPHTTHQGDVRPWAAAGSSRNGRTQAVEVYSAMPAIPNQTTEFKPTQKKQQTYIQPCQADEHTNHPYTQGCTRS